MGRRGPFARIRPAPKLTPPDHRSADRQAPYGVCAGLAHRLAAAIEEVASRLGAGGPRPEGPRPLLNARAYAGIHASEPVGEPGASGWGRTVGLAPLAWDWRLRGDGPSDDAGWVGRLDRRRRSRELARRRAWGCVRGDLPRHRGGFRPQGGIGRQGHGGLDHRHTRAVTLGGTLASVVSP
jgi:hypothetical protein